MSKLPDAPLPFSLQEIVGDGWRYDPLERRYNHRDGTAVSYYAIADELEKMRKHNHMAKIVDMQKSGHGHLAMAEAMYPTEREIAPTNEQKVMILNKYRELINQPEL